MYLVFLDGSGNTGLNLTQPTSPLYLLMGLAADGTPLEDAMTRILAARFGAASAASSTTCTG